MSERDSVSALTGQVEELRQQLAQACADIASAKAIVTQWDARLEREGIGATFVMRAEFKKLREQVADLATALAGAMERGKLKNPPAPRWDDLDRSEAAAQFADLRGWVDGVLRVQYPEYPLPACWAAHREALWELGTLRAEWLRIYPSPGQGGDLVGALEFHERWLPGVLNRLNRAIPCDQAGCHLKLRPRQKGTIR
jgi:hypothetical protein